MSEAISDAEQISQKIDGYVRGCQTGDEAYLKTSFHPDARMFGAVGPDRYDLPIFGGMSAAVAGQPTVDHDAKILSMDVEGDAASVMLAESRFWGQGLHRLLPALVHRRGVADRREGLHQHRTEQLTGERLTAAAASAAT